MKSLDLSKVMRRLKYASREIQFSSAETLKTKQQGSVGSTAAPVYDNAMDENAKIENTLLRIRGGGKTSDTNTKKLSKGQKRKKRLKAAIERKQNIRRKNWKNDKKTFIESQINHYHVQIELSNTSLNELKHKLDKSTGTKFQNNLLMSVCKINDEKDYFQNKLKKTEIRLIQLADDNRTKRLTRDTVKRRSVPSGDRVTRSSTLLHEGNTNVVIANTDIVDDSDHSIIEFSSSDESEDDLNDEDFILDHDHIEEEMQSAISSSKPKSSSKPMPSSKQMMNSKPTMSNKPTSTKRTKKEFQPKSSEYLSQKYKSRQIDSDSEMEDYNDIVLNQQTTPYKNHQWVYDLKQMDSSIESFANNFLVVVRGNASKVSKYSYDDLEESPSVFEKSIHLILFIQRGQYTQFYILKKLQKSLHFTLGPKSTKVLIEYCKSNKIQYQKYTHRYQINNSSITLRNQILPSSSADSLESQYSNKMIEFANIILPTLLMTKKPDTSRASHVINLGITDLKVHLHKRKSISGQNGLHLISTWTKNIKVSHQAKTFIGQLLMFVIKNVIPTTCSPDIFSPAHDVEKEYLKLFAKQLNLIEEEDINTFNIPAISILINKSINPHYDSKNPIIEEHDATCSITTLVPIESLSSSIQHIIPKEFTSAIPLCIVMYRRQCLDHLSKNQLKIDNYISSDNDFSAARKKIVQILSHSVYSDLDYGGLFFSRHRNRLLENRFVIHDNRIFKDNKMALINEAVDKCGFWSSLLHVYYLYAYFYGVEQYDVLSFILFFGHQCNTTTIIVKAMMTIIANHTSTKTNELLYRSLANICLSYKIKDNDKDVGCGGGGVERFGPSNNSLYSDEEICKSCVLLNKLFGEATQDITSQARLTPEHCYECYWKLEKQIMKLKGIGKVRSSHLIQLASLLGVIPLQYYVYLPIHMEGGTGEFLKNEFGFSYVKPNDHTTLLQKHTRELGQLQDIYGLNFTSNMFENMCCILGRSQRREIFDIFYYLPWVKKDEGKNPVLTTVPKIQLTFKVKVHSTKHIDLVCKSDHNESIVISSKPNTHENSSIIVYNKVRIDDTNKSLLILDKTGHHINCDWIERQFTTTLNPLPDIQHVSLPKFENYYNKVRVL